MKRVFILLSLLVVTFASAYAQKGRQAIGFGLSYGTEIESVGFGLKYQYNITSPIRLEPSFNYFFKNDDVSMLDINMNFHYLCPVGRDVKLYPLLGFTFANWMFDADKPYLDDNVCRVGLNLGVGADFKLAPSWTMNCEFRYQLVSDFDQAVFNIGFAYRF